jgi:hypothetical protein
MSLFVDQMLLQLSDPAQLIQLLSPATDTQHSRLLTLLKTMYGLPLTTMYGLPIATIHDVKNIAISQKDVEFQRLLLTTHEQRGTWTQSAPNHVRTDVVYEGSDRLEPLWLDIAAKVDLKLLLEVDRSEIQSINTHSLDQVTIQVKKPPPFDPNDPANLYSYTLNVAILIRDTIDVAATLHDIKLASTVSERIVTYSKEVDVAEVLVPFAPIVIFPQTALTGIPLKPDALQSFFALEGVLALFMTPS